MASEVQIANFALTLLGEKRIVSLSDASKQAREIKALFEMTRDALLAGYNWVFAMTRTQLSPLAEVPAFQFGQQFQLPTDCLRIVLIGETYVGADLSDFRGFPVDEFVLEGRRILTDLGAPLSLRYVKQVTDTTQFDPSFAKAFAARLAADAAEAITQSAGKRDRAEVAFQKEINLATRANAIQLPPVKLADDEWMASRL